MRATVFYNIKCDYERWLCHSDFGGTALNDLKTKTQLELYLPYVSWSSMLYNQIRRQDSNIYGILKSLLPASENGCEVFRSLIMMQ
jgi:hypothetical protein